LDTSGVVALDGSIVPAAAVEAILSVGLAAPFLPPEAILYLIGLSSYSIIKDG
jgi:hypothetical protein